MGEQSKKQKNQKNYPFTSIERIKAESREIKRNIKNFV